MKNKDQIVIVIIVLAVLGAMFLIYQKNSSENDSAISISGYYDANRQLIKSGMAVVGGVQGVEYVTLRVNIHNTDTVPLELTILDATPASFKSALGTNKLTVQPGQTSYWESNLIDIEPFVGKTQVFNVKVRASSPSRVNVEKESSLSIKVDPDSIGASFDLTVTSSTGTSGTDLSCIEAWSCTTGSCINGVQTKTCTDANNCGTTTNRPSLTQSCTSTGGGSSNFETNAGTTFASFTTGTWIKADTDGNGAVETYNYNQASTSSCIGNPYTSYNGFTINKYSGSQGTSIILCNNAGSGYKKYT